MRFDRTEAGQTPSLRPASEVRSDRDQILEAMPDAQPAALVLHIATFNAAPVEQTRVAQERVNTHRRWRSRRQGRFPPALLWFAVLTHRGSIRSHLKR